MSVKSLAGSDDSSELITPASVEQATLDVLLEQLAWTRS